MSSQQTSIAVENAVGAVHIENLTTVAGISAMLKSIGKTFKNCEIGREHAHLNGELHSPLNGRQPIFALLGYEDIRSLEGRLLTIMDASFTDREQRKAAKDLVRNAIWFDWAPNLDMDGSGGKPDLRS